MSESGIQSLERTRESDSADNDASSALHKKMFCTFVLDEGLFGVEVERVQEIIRFQRMTSVPQAPGEVAGLINLRGDIVPAIDLRACLQLPPHKDATEPTNVVVRTTEGAVSLLVDDIGDVVDVDSESFEQAPDNLRGVTRDMIRCVYKLDGRLLMALAVEAVIEAATAKLTQRQEARSLS